MTAPGHGGGGGAGRDHAPIGGGRRLEFCVSLAPTAAAPQAAARMARTVERLRLDLDAVGVRDHPADPAVLEATVTLASLLPVTERVPLTLEVMGLGQRSPALLAKTISTLTALGEGRVRVALAAGSGEGVLLERALTTIHAVWDGSWQPPAATDGRQWSPDSVRSARPAHQITIWAGTPDAAGAELAGRLADGWVVSADTCPPGRVPALGARLGEAAAAAGRDPTAVRRAYLVPGLIGGTGSGDGDGGRLTGPVGLWVERLTAFVDELGFDTIVFAPAERPLKQAELFAREVVPAVRDRVERRVRWPLPRRARGRSQP